MNYQSHEELGSIIQVGTALFEVGKAGYNYYMTNEEVNKANASATIANASSTVDARQAGYASNLAKLTGAIDMEKAKRYLIIGVAIGVPLIAYLVLSKRKG